jgi:hypothetical protein
MLGWLRWTMAGRLLAGTGSCNNLRWTRGASWSRSLDDGRMLSLDGRRLRWLAAGHSLAALAAGPSLAVIGHAKFLTRGH